MDENTSKANKIGPTATVMSTAEMVDFLMELARGERSFYTVGTREGLMSVAIHLRTISNVLFRKMGDEKPKAVEEKPKTVEGSTLPATKEETSVDAGTFSQPVTVHQSSSAYFPFPVVEAENTDF